MSLILDGSSGVTFPDVSTQAKAGLVAGGTIATGTVTALSTNGVTFPATQSASSDANTLDDYEEGTFTPTFEGTSGVTYQGTTIGFYQKVGKRVNFFALVATSALTTNGNQITIGGLPFVVASLSSEYYEPMSVFIQNGFTKTGILGYQPLAVPGTATIGVYALVPSSGNNYIAVQYNELTVATNMIRVSGSYFATN